MVLKILSNFVSGCWSGVPNTLNVITNFPFLVVGVLGFVFCVRGDFFNIRFCFFMYISMVIVSLELILIDGFCLLDISWELIASVCEEKLGVGHYFMLELHGWLMVLLFII